MITTQDILNVIQSVCPNIDTSKIDPNTRLREYGIDSMDFFNIILELQELLKKEIPDEDIDQVRTISSIKEYFRKHSG